MLINNKSYKTIWYDKNLDSVRVIDQTKLPFNLEIISLNKLDDIIKAINEMKVRGAPLIGATAAYGIYIAYRELKNKNNIKEEALKIMRTRPTAFNLFWAVNKMLSIIDKDEDEEVIEKILLKEAEKICENDIEQCKKIGINGLEIINKIHQIKGEVNILTHCNAGWLATIDWGTATAPMYLAKKNNLNIHVWVDETRPRNQGASLTSYELNNEGIKNTIITDNTAGLLMQRGLIDLCIVGADRVTNTGHVANKIGTFIKAVLANEFNIPFYVAIPTSTIDWKTKMYEDIIIEERSDKELSHITGLDNNNEIRTIKIYPDNSKVYNPAFDITPNKFIKSFITEKGIINANYQELISLKNE